METYKEVVRQSDKNSRLLKTTVGLNVKNVTHTILCNHHCLQTDLLVQLRPTCHSLTVPPPAPSGSSFGLLTTCLSLLLVFAGLSDLL